MRDDFPLPDVTEPLTRGFWQAAAKGVLAMPRTADGRWHWYPKSEDVTWVPVSGQATVFSWTQVHHAFLPAYADRLPFLTGLVTLQEDPSLRLATRFVDCESVAIGEPVEVVFRPMRFPTVPGLKVRAPFFRPV